MDCTRGGNMKLVEFTSGHTMLDEALWKAGTVAVNRWNIFCWTISDEALRNYVCDSFEGIFFSELKKYSGEGDVYVDSLLLAWERASDVLYMQKAFYGLKAWVWPLYFCPGYDPKYVIPENPRCLAYNFASLKRDAQWKSEMKQLLSIFAKLDIVFR
jgi:hypothetical protein